MQDPRTDMKSSLGLKTLCLAQNCLSLHGSRLASLLNELLLGESNSPLCSGVGFQLYQALTFYCISSHLGYCNSLTNSTVPWTMLPCCSHSSFRLLLRVYCVSEAFKYSTKKSSTLPSSRDKWRSWLYSYVNILNVTELYTVECLTW